LDLKLTLRLALVNLFFKLLNVITALLSFFGKAILLFLKLLADLFDFIIEIVLLGLEIIVLFILLSCFIDVRLKIAEGLVFSHEFHHILRDGTQVSLVSFDQFLVSSNIWIVLQLSAELPGRYSKLI